MSFQLLDAIVFGSTQCDTTLFDSSQRDAISFDSIQSDATSLGDSFARLALTLSLTIDCRAI